MKKIGIDFHQVANDIYESYDNCEKPKQKDLKELYELSKEFVKDYENLKKINYKKWITKSFPDRETMETSFADNDHLVYDHEIQVLVGREGMEYQLSVKVDGNVKIDGYKED